MRKEEKPYTENTRSPTSNSLWFDWASPAIGKKMPSVHTIPAQQNSALKMTAKTLNRLSLFPIIIISPPFCAKF